MKTEISLYNLEGCPFCHLVRKKLEQLQLPALIIPVPKKGEDRTELIKISAQKTVPTLVDGDKVITDSTEIMKYLDLQYGDGKITTLLADDYGLRTVIQGDFATIKEKTIQVFLETGFGVLSETDVQETMKKKLNLEIAPNTILGVCNPKIANQLMESEPDSGLLLPCNVVIREDVPGRYHVTVINPVKLFSLIGRDDMMAEVIKIKQMMAEAIEKLSKA
jgi:uncharacterized protein (DUF302 family)/glutaredoxin